MFSAFYLPKTMIDEQSAVQIAWNILDDHYEGVEDLTVDSFVYHDDIKVAKLDVAWLFGLSDGARVRSPRQVKRDFFCPTNNSFNATDVFAADLRNFSERDGAVLVTVTLENDADADDDSEYGTAIHPELEFHFGKTIAEVEELAVKKRAELARDVLDDAIEAAVTLLGPHLFGKPDKEASRSQLEMATAFVLRDLGFELLQEAEKTMDSEQASAARTAAHKRAMELRAAPARTPGVAAAPRQVTFPPMRTWPTPDAVFQTTSAASSLNASQIQQFRELFRDDQADGLVNIAVGSLTREQN